MVKEIAGIVSEQSHCHENQDRYHGNQDRCHGNPDRYHGNPDRYHGIPDRCQEDLEDPFFPSSDLLSESDPYSIGKFSMRITFDYATSGKFRILRFGCLVRL